MLRANEIRPDTTPSESHKDWAACPTQQSLPLLTDVPHALAGVLVVVVEMPEDRVRRRVFLSLHTAQRHADRARDRGLCARVFLAELAPVAEVGL